MKFELWLAFIATYSVISLIPGPSVFMVIGESLSNGTKAAFLCILGDIVGGFFLIALSLFGVGAILAASAELFQLVKWAGILYMAYLGVCQIIEARQGDKLEDTLKGSSSGLASARKGFLIGILNPKAVLFYVAFLSQFLEPTGNAYLQFAILVATSTVIVGVILGGYALVAARARNAFQSAKARRRINYTGGGFLIAGSVVMAQTR